MSEYGSENYTLVSWAQGSGLAVFEKTSTSGKKEDGTYKEDTVMVPDLRTASLDTCIAFFEEFPDLFIARGIPAEQQNAEYRLKNCLTTQLGTKLINDVRIDLRGPREDDSEAANLRNKIRSLAGEERERKIAEAMATFDIDRDTAEYMMKKLAAKRGDKKKAAKLAA